MFQISSIGLLIEKNNINSRQEKVKNNQCQSRIGKGFLSGKLPALFENYNHRVSWKIKIDDLHNNSQGFLSFVCSSGASFKYCLKNFSEKAV